jgi:hypothetical protein
MANRQTRARKKLELKVRKQLGNKLVNPPSKRGTPWRSDFNANQRRNGKTAPKMRMSL